jgi:hypothetical protein
LRYSIFGILLLAGCAGPTALISNLSFNGNIAPYPENYAEVVGNRLLSPGETAMMAQPVEGTAYSTLDPRGWYVCLLRSGQPVQAAFIDTSGRVAGTIDAAEFVCKGTTIYESYTRASY